MNRLLLEFLQPPTWDSGDAALTLETASISPYLQQHNVDHELWFPQRVKQITGKRQHQHVSTIMGLP